MRREAFRNAPTLLLLCARGTHKRARCPAPRSRGSKQLGDLSRPTKADLEAAMDGNVLAEAVLMGTYQKTG
jgi:hypothetical protein